MIDRGDIRQAIDRCSNIWASLPGAVISRSSIRLTAWLQNSKKWRNGQRDYVWAESPRLSPLWLSASSSACRAVNHYRDNAITYKAQRDKNARELKLANAAITDMQMRQRCCCARCKIHEGVSDAKAENDALRDDVAAGRRRLHISSLSVSAWSHHASGVDNAASPRLADTAERGLFHPQREADHYAKTTGRNPEVLMSRQIELPISMGNYAIIVSNTHALPAEYKCLK